MLTHTRSSKAEALRGTARPAGVTSACQDGCRTNRHLIKIRRRAGPTTASNSGLHRPGLAFEIAPLTDPPAGYASPTLAGPTTRRLGKNIPEPIEPKDHLHRSKLGGRAPLSLAPGELGALRTACWLCYRPRPPSLCCCKRFKACSGVAYNLHRLWPGYYLVMHSELCP